MVIKNWKKFPIGAPEMSEMRLRRGGRRRRGRDNDDDDDDETTQNPIPNSKFKSTFACAF